MVEYKEINIEDIILSGKNPRESFNEASLIELGKSMSKAGQIQEIIVRPKGDKFELVVGERRYRAAKLTGIPKLRARIEEMNDAKMMRMQLIENIHREDLTESEKGKSVSSMLLNFPEEFPTIGVLAQELKKSETTINKWLMKSERLSDFVKKSVFGGRLSDHSASWLLKLDHATQDKLATAIINYKIPPRTEGEPHLEFIKRYELDPDKYPTVESLQELANEIKGIKTVSIDLSKLSPKARAEVDRKLEEAHEEAKKLKAQRSRTQGVRKPKRNLPRQGRPKKVKPTAEEITRKPIPEPTIPLDAKIITVAFGLPEPLWEKLHRYIQDANRPMLLEDAIVYILENSPLLRNI